MFNGISIVCFVEMGYWLLVLLFRLCFNLEDYETSLTKSPINGKLELLKMTGIDYCQASIYLSFDISY